MPAQKLPDPLDLMIQAESRKRDIPADVIRAIVHVESSGDVFAWNPEPPYRYYWNVKLKAAFRKVTAAELASEVPPDDFPCFPGHTRDAEWWGQAASWGPMQVMGAVARELGFTAQFPALCDTLAGISIGVAHVNRLRASYFGKFGWHGVVAAYNAGTPRLDASGRYENQQYVDKIIATGGLEGL